MPDELIFGSYLNEKGGATISTNAVPIIICVYLEHKTLSIYLLIYIFSKKFLF